MNITELCGYAYESAITTVANIINEQLDTSYSYTCDYEVIENIAKMLNVQFDENGEIIKER